MRHVGVALFFWVTASGCLGLVTDSLENTPQSDNDGDGDALGGGDSTHDSDDDASGTDGDDEPITYTIALVPNAATTSPTGYALFHAEVVGDPDAEVHWSIQEGSAGGSINDAGRYTAPAAEGTYHVIATADGVAAATATVTVVAPTPCPADGAPTGVWEKVSPKDTEIETKSVALDPFDSDIVWAANEKGLNKSTDCGATWELVSTGENGYLLANSSLWSIALDHETPGTIYLVGGYGANGIWKSTNGGVDWVDLVHNGTEYHQHQPYRAVNNVTMDPEDPLHLLITTHGTCTDAYLPTCNAETFDGGETWTLKNAPSGWPERGGAFMIDATTVLFSDPYHGLWRTEDGGESWSHVWQAQGGNGEFTNQLFLPASDGAYYLSSIYGVLRSADKGATWAWVQGGASDHDWSGFAMSATTLYVSKQNSNVFASAPISEPTNWTTMDSPQTGIDNRGAPFMVFDEQRGILYASMWNAGLWRMKVP